MDFESDKVRPSFSDEDPASCRQNRKSNGKTTRNMKTGRNEEKTIQNERCKTINGRQNNDKGRENENTPAETRSRVQAQLETLEKRTQRQTDTHTVAAHTHRRRTHTQTPHTAHAAHTPRSKKHLTGKVSETGTATIQVVATPDAAPVVITAAITAADTDTTAP